MDLTVFDISWVRFATSGTLILCHGIADTLSRRRSKGSVTPVSAVWVRVVTLVSITAFYTLIGATGSALFGGVGNLTGIVIALLATTVRLHGTVRYPEVTARCLFYLSLPLAVGVPWGWLALSLPACATSIYRCWEVDRSRATAPVVSPAYRMVPGIW